MTETPGRYGDVIGECLRAAGLPHLELVAAGGSQWVQPVAGWRSYAIQGVDEDEHVIDRMRDLDAAAWPELRIEGEQMTLRADGSTRYHGADADAFCSALIELLDGPGYRRPVMLMRAVTEAQGLGLEVVYLDEVPED